MANMVEAGDRVRVASLGNAVGTVTQVRGEKVWVDVPKLRFILITTKARVHIASKASA